MCTKRLTLYMLHRSLRWRGSSRHIRNDLRNVLGCMNMPHTGTCRSLYTSDCRSPVSEQSPASSSLSAASCMSVYLLRRRISWHETVTNKEVLRTVKEDRQMLNSIRQRKHRWIGNVLRHDGLLHEITVGSMGEEFKCYMIWQTMVALLHSSGQLRTDRVETQRKDVKNLLYSRRRFIIELNSRRLLTMRITHLGRIRVVATALATTTTETDAVLMLFFRSAMYSDSVHTKSSGPRPRCTHVAAIHPPNAPCVYC